MQRLEKGQKSLQTKKRDANANYEKGVYFKDVGKGLIVSKYISLYANISIGFFLFWFCLIHLSGVLKGLNIDDKDRRWESGNV